MRRRKFLPTWSSCFVRTSKNLPLWRVALANVSSQLGFNYWSWVSLSIFVSHYRELEKHGRKGEPLWVNIVHKPRSTSTSESGRRLVRTACLRTVYDLGDVTIYIVDTARGLELF